jgi:hypothetical protein
MSTFDINSLLNTQVTEANDTQLIPVPEGEWTGVISKTELRVVKGKDGEAPVCEVYWDVDSDEVVAITGRDKNQVRQSVWLDLTASGTLDMGKGKNTSLGRLRDALGQNTPGKPWSFGMLLGQVATVVVSHRVADDGQVNAQVKKVLPM